MPYSLPAVRANRADVACRLPLSGGRRPSQTCFESLSRNRYFVLTPITRNEEPAFASAPSVVGGRDRSLPGRARANQIGATVVASAAVVVEGVAGSTRTSMRADCYGPAGAEIVAGPELCGLPQLIRLDQKLRRNFPRIVDSIDHLGRERALP
jgi:hypothetical protein